MSFLIKPQMAAGVDILVYNGQHLSDFEIHNHIELHNYLCTWWKDSVVLGGILT